MFSKSSSLLFVCLCLTALAAAQSGAADLPAAVVRYADMVVHNAKVMTMDDSGINTSPGTLAQALAVRDGKVLAVGTNEKILALAGPKTQKIDAKGRTVIPGIINAHTHQHDNGFVEWLQAGNAPGLIAQFQATGKTYDELKKNIEVTLKERRGTVKPGEWIFLNLPRFDDREIGTAFLQDKAVTLNDLDAWAPDHPVLAMAHPAYMINTKGKQALKDLYGFEPIAGEEVDEQGFTYTGVEYRRSIPVDKNYRGQWARLGDVLKWRLDRQAAAGITTFSSHIMGKEWFNAYMHLVRTHQMPMRFAYSHYQALVLNPYAAIFYSRLGDMAGLGNDYFWQSGVGLSYTDSGPPEICSSIPAIPDVKRREWCRLSPGSTLYKVAYEAIRSGSRVVLGHTYGDKALDEYMDLLENIAREEPSMGLDYIRSRRMTSDHCGFYPRPDQVARIKKLGMIISCGSGELSRSWPLLEIYGMQYASWISPVKTLLDGGVKTVFESELSQAEIGLFRSFVPFITRKNRDGKLVSPENAVDRVTVMKMATVWPSEYVLKEDVLGSLQPGKWADFLILNKDYFTVPVEEIGTVFPLMTVVGGKTVFLRSELAKELGVQTLGAQFKYRFEPGAPQ
ncbi:MAG: amidohydrolase family protein [Acidobacteria bacterium]|nr:amidohydrolase family protein [Acidobacteriota bacterium]